MVVAYQTQVVPVTPEDLKDWVTGDPQSRELSISGPCPVCHYPYNGMVQTDVTVVGLLEDRAAPNFDNVPKLCECNCNEVHAGRPDTITTGCGASWVIAVTKQAGETYKVAPGDLRYLPALRTFNEAVEDELKNIRTSAGSWVQGVAALLGLFSLAGLVFAKDAIADLASGYQEAFAGLAAFALAAAAAGTFLAYRAAYGWPHRYKVDNVSKLQDFLNNYQERASRSSLALKSGVACTFAAVAGLLAALIVLWFGPSATPPEPLVKVTSSDGSISCGNLLKAGPAPAQLVRIRTADGKIVTIRPASVRELTIVDKC